MKIQVNEKIKMEILCNNHAAEIIDLTETDQNYLRKWLPWLDQVKTVSDTEEFIKSTIQEYNAGGAPNFAVLYSGVMCGVAGFHEINREHKLGSIGYWLGEKFTGNGIITSTTNELLKIGFQKYNLNRIEVRCAEGNTKSRKIPERLGFTYEATLRQCEWLYSKYVDHSIYSMLASEYNA